MLWSGAMSAFCSTMVAWASGDSDCGCAGKSAAQATAKTAAKTMKDFMLILCCLLCWLIQENWIVSDIRSNAAHWIYNGNFACEMPYSSANSAPIWKRYDLYRKSALQITIGGEPSARLLFKKRVVCEGQTFDDQRKEEKRTSRNALNLKVKTFSFAVGSTLDLLYKCRLGHFFATLGKMLMSLIMSNLDDQCKS